MSFVLTNTSSTRRKKRSSRKKDDGITLYKETKTKILKNQKLPNFERTKIKNPKKLYKGTLEEKESERETKKKLLLDHRIPIMYYHISFNNGKKLLPP